MIKAVIDNLINLFRFHKKKILAFIALILLFSLTLFPYDDLSDLIGTKITKATNNKVYLQFDTLNIGFLPTPNIEFENVEVVAKRAPTLKAKLLKVSPSILDLMKFNIGARIYAEDFLNAEVDGGFIMGRPNKDNITIHGFDVDVENLELRQINDLVKLPIKLKGKIDLQAEGSFDPNFSEQPNIEFNLDGEKINLPAPSIPLTGFGSINLPDIDLSKSKITGRLVDGELILEEANLGSGKDKIQISLKGKVGLKFNKSMAGARPKISNYDIKTKISIDASLKDQLYFLTLLEPYKTSSGKKLVYTLKATARSLNSPPKMTKITNF